MGNRFAAGKRAFGFCDICSFRYPLPKLKELIVRTKKTNMLACPTCWSVDHPQNMQGMYPVDDPQALRRPRPDLSLVATSVATGSRDIQWGWNPVGGARDFTANETPNDLVAVGIIGTVTIT
jgi:hypothetical protein